MITGYIEEVTESENRTADPKEYGCFHDAQFVIPRGTAYTMKFDLRNLMKWSKAAGRILSAPFLSGDSCFFGIKKNPDDSGYLYQYIARAEYSASGRQQADLSKNGCFTVTLSPSDTDLEPGIYYYSVAVHLGNSSGFFEAVPATPFRIRSMMIQSSDWQS